MRRAQTGSWPRRPRPKRTPKAMLRIIRELEAQGFTMWRGKNWHRERTEAENGFLDQPASSMPMNERAAAAMAQFNIPRG